jgi:hypothetical protein
LTGIGHFVIRTRDVMQIQDFKVLHQLLSMDQIGSQLGIIAAALPFDLLDDELGVASHE